MKRFWIEFLSLEGSLLYYIIGTAALTIVMQFFYDLIDASWGLMGTGVLTLLLLLITFGLVRNEYRKARRSETLVVNSGVKVAPHKGLILLVGFQTDAAIAAIDHHIPVLEHVWVIASKGSVGFADEIVAYIHTHFSEQVKVYDVMDHLVDDIDDTEKSWRIVERIYSEEAGALGLTAADIISDITGASKPMTAGMALACASADRDMEYVKTPRDENGDPVPGAEKVPVLIQTKFIHPHSLGE